jgi:putative exporter of polyketide antibiotics
VYTSTSQQWINLLIKLGIFLAVLGVAVYLNRSRNKRQ